MTNAQKIALIREILDLKPSGLAALLNVTERTVYRWLDGTREPHASIVSLAEKYLSSEGQREFWRLVDSSNLTDGLN